MHSHSIAQGLLRPLFQVHILSVSFCFLLKPSHDEGGSLDPQEAVVCSQSGQRDESVVAHCAPWVIPCGSGSLLGIWETGKSAALLWGRFFFLIIWNTWPICMSSSCRHHANLFCIVLVLFKFLVYELPKWASILFMEWLRCLDFSGQRDWVEKAEADKSGVYQLHLSAFRLCSGHLTPIGLI